MTDPEACTQGTLCRVMSTCTLGLPAPIFSELSFMLTMLLLTTSSSFGGVASRYLTCMQRNQCSLAVLCSHPLTPAVW